MTDSTPLIKTLNCSDASGDPMSYHARRATAAWQRFRSAVQSQGGVVVEDRWLGGGVPHRVRCKTGHDGFGNVIRILRDYPDAFKLEERVRRTLRDAGMTPVRGREYFDACTLGLIMDIVDHSVPSQATA